MHHRITALAATALVLGSFVLVGAGSASAQQVIEPSVLADAECSPTGDQQGIQLTFINGNVTAVTITGATASGTLLPAPLDLTFVPADLSVEEAATADFVFPGDAAGSVQVTVEWFGDNETSGATAAAFDVTPCVPTTDTTEATTTSTAAPAVAAEATATFTG